jgi:asparagine synthetase B (glutamine-hydrolysing)
LDKGGTGMLNDWRTAIDNQVITEPNPDWSEKELEEILRVAIKNCAEQCMDSNESGRVFTSLSGGLDSSFCLAIIRQLFPRAVISTYTTGGNENHPDIQSARLIARLFHTFHVEIIPEENEEKLWNNDFKDTFPDIQNPAGGDVAVFCLYRVMAIDGAKAAITHDGIDELLGGYWSHRANCGPHQEDAFRDLWKRLVPEHLEPLQRDVDYFGIRLFLPYLQLPVVKYIAGIPVHQRTSRAESKIPLRNIARKYLPSEIIERKKEGFCSGLDKF